MSAEPYAVIARIYDKWVGVADHKRMIAFVDAHVAAGVDERRALDICCGTATLSVHLAKEGYRVVAVDGSEAMLDEARKKVAAAGVAARVTLGSCDVLKVPLPAGTFDLVLCTFDSVNYFPPTAVEKLFTEIAERLTPQGRFVFDINSERKIKTLFGNSVYAETSEQYCYIWKNTLYEADDRIQYDITVFMQEPSELYRRQEERHVQYIYRHDDLVAKLKRAGLEVIAANDDFGTSPFTDQSLRISYVVGRANG